MSGNTGSVSGPAPGISTRAVKRGDVAAQARIVVVAPGAADVVGAFEDDEVVDARTL
jgi:hypothetical protein